MMEDWEKHKKNLLRVENVVAAMFFVSMIVSALEYVEELPWLGVPLILLDVIFMFCHCMSVYHEGASDAWRKAVDISLKHQSERRYKAIFWTYWSKDNGANSLNWRNGFYERACKEVGIDQHWDLNEAPDVVEKADVYDLYPHNENPVECVLDARTIEADSFEKLSKLRDELCKRNSGVIHCCLDLQPMKEVEDE